MNTTEHAPRLGSTELPERLQDVLDRAGLLGQFCTYKTANTPFFNQESPWRPMSAEDDSPGDLTTLRIRTCMVREDLESLAVDSSPAALLEYDESMGRFDAFTPNRLMVIHSRLAYVSLFGETPADKTYVTPNDVSGMDRVEEILGQTERAFLRTE